MATDRIERNTDRRSRPAGEGETRLASAVRHVTNGARAARTRASAVLAHVPGTIGATRAGAQGATSALQTLPDPTLRGIAATSVGLGAGFYFAGAPKLVVAAGVVPALLMGAAIVLRPIGLVASAEEDR